LLPVQDSIQLDIRRVVTIKNGEWGFGKQELDEREFDKRRLDERFLRRIDGMIPLPFCRNASG